MARPGTSGGVISTFEFLPICLTIALWTFLSLCAAMTTHTRLSLGWCFSHSATNSSASREASPRSSLLGNAVSAFAMYSTRASPLRLSSQSAVMSSAVVSFDGLICWNFADSDSAIFFAMCALPFPLRP